MGDSKRVMGNLRAGSSFASQSIRLTLTITLFVAASCFQSSALDPNLQLTQYGHTAWRVREGYFSGPPLAITQTKDGQLWIGGEGGLIRFDGVQFVPWHPPEGSHLPDNRVYGLLGASDGSLWIGTGNGLARWKDGKLTVYARMGRFSALVEDHHGTVWAGHTRALDSLPPICRFSQDQFQCFPIPDQSSVRYVGSLYVDRSDNLWLGSENTVCRWEIEKTHCYEINKQPGSAEKFGVFSITVDSGGDLWADGGSTGIWRLAAGSWKRYDDFPTLKIESQAMFTDRQDGLWIGSLESGLIRRVKGRTERFTRADGLSGDVVTGIFEDREGNVWVATSSGLDRFRDVKVATLTSREGLPVDIVGAITASRDGGLWIAGERQELIYIKDSEVKSYQANRDLPGNSVTSLFEDSRGRLWVGVGKGLAWLEHGRFHPLPLPQPCSSGGVVRNLAEDVDGTIWVSMTDRGCALLSVHDGRVLQVLSQKQTGGQIAAMAADPGGGVWLGLASGPELYRNGRVEFLPDKFPSNIQNLFADADGLWAATSEGFALYQPPKLAVLNARNGLPCEGIEVAIKDGHGALWLKTTCGLVQISADELQLWMKDPGRRVSFRYLDAFDGAQAGIPPFRPVATRSTDGRLSFAIESGGIQVIDPMHMDDNAIPPPVQVTGVVADRKTYQPVPNLRLPSLTRDLEIRYTAYSLAIPEKVRFRYRLEGADSSWQDVGTRREAFFNNLKPGDYHFQLAASNNDGVWNNQGASLEFVIPPAFYQTAWFRILFIAALGCVSWGAYQWRIRQVAARLDAQFGARLSERTRIAQELHDTLLQGILSASMQLHVAESQIPANSPAKTLVSRVLELMEQVVTEGRGAVRGLRLSKERSLDLEQALSRVPQELAVDESAVNFRVIAEGVPRSLRPAVRDEVYRIGREAVTNAFRHSHANRIEVVVEHHSKHLRVLVSDNGEGMDSRFLQSGREGHWGLSGMRERAEKIGAKLKVCSNNEGTEVELVVPGSIAFEAHAPGASKWLSLWHARKTATESRDERQVG
jgi:signal transduction histidine kinase/ligand-binding sensor domain-containing protein